MKPSSTSEITTSVKSFSSWCSPHTGQFRLDLKWLRVHSWEEETKSYNSKKKIRREKRKVLGPCQCLSTLYLLFLTLAKHTTTRTDKNGAIDRCFTFIAPHRKPSVHFLHNRIRRYKRRLGGQERLVAAF